MVKTISTNKRGTPDVLACHNGQFIAVEVKRPGGKLSKLQDYQIRRIQQSGGKAFVATSIEDVKHELDKEPGPGNQDGTV